MMTAAEELYLLSLPVQTDEQRQAISRAAADAGNRRKAELRAFELANQANRRQTAYNAFLAARANWLPELQKYAGPKTWIQYGELRRHFGDAFLVIESSDRPPLTKPLYAWYSAWAMRGLEGDPNLSPGFVGTQYLPRVQYTSTAELLSRKFGSDKTRKNPYDWVDPNGHLVVLWLDDDHGRHDGATDSITDVINACQRFDIPLWLGCSYKFRYGEKHKQHSARIDQWLETARVFELGKGGA